MVRTQIQLSEEQSTRLKRRAALSDRSVADIIREAVDLLLARSPDQSRGNQMRRATSAFGAFSSGVPDLGTGHDRHLADTIEPRR